MNGVEINFTAVLVSAVIIFLLGALWYSPVMFASPWMKAINKSAEELKKETKPTNYLIAFLQGLITSYILSIFISWAQASNLESGAWIGFMCWFGFAGTTSLVYNSFAGRNLKLWMI
ncbi:MAG: DUF1761 domain-containing protein, partial [Ignavibacteriales bacterium]